MDGKAFPELKELLMNATPLSGLFQTMKIRVGKGRVFTMPPFGASLDNYVSLGTLYRKAIEKSF